ALSFTVLGNATASYTPKGGSATTVPVEDSVNIAALIASGAITFDPVASNGQQQTVNWHYNPNAADLDWLRDGDTLTLTFSVRFQDNHGGFSTQNLVITITGTEDVPSFSGVTNPSLSEITGDSSAQIIHVNGDITVTDQDLGDTLSVSVANPATASYKPVGGVFGALPNENSVNVAALIAAGAITFDTATSNGEQVVI